MIAVHFSNWASAQGHPAAPAARPPTGEAPEDNRKYDLEIQKVLSVNKTDYVIFQGLKVKRFNKTGKVGAARENERFLIHLFSQFTLLMESSRSMLISMIRGWLKLGAGEVSLETTSGNCRVSSIIFRKRFKHF